MKRVLKNLAVLAGVLLLLAAAGLLFGCPVKRITGLPCPGCGMTRACLSLLRLDFAAAVRWHPLCFIIPLLALMFVFKDTAAGKRLWSCVPLLAGIAALCLLTYLVRMALYFPHTPPMNAEENSLFVKIVHKFLLQ